jgi:predicted nucleic acid-binding protein
MSDRHVFVDTNVLVYAHDADAGPRHIIAKQKVKTLWSAPLPPSISVQVLQELYVNLVRKGSTSKAARELVADYFAWDVVPNSADLLRAAMSGVERWKISLWDSLVIAAAGEAGAGVLWSEDLNEGQDYDGVVVVNPLRS